MSSATSSSASVRVYQGFDGVGWGRGGKSAVLIRSNRLKENLSCTAAKSAEATLKT
jgi:hypothetical protein